MQISIEVEGVSSDDNGRCIVDGNSALMCISISLKSSTGSMCGKNIPVVAASM